VYARVDMLALLGFQPSAQGLCSRQFRVAQIADHAEVGHDGGQALVEALRAHAATLDLGRYILMGRGEESSGGRERTSTLADAFEALIGAIYLDGGLEAAKEFILTQTRGDLEQLAETPVDINPKGQLQELLQSISPRSPVYELVSQSGPEHEKMFVSQVVWEGIVLGHGSGRSKKQAETVAALEAMELKRWEKKL